MCLWYSSLGREEIIRKQVHLWFPSILIYDVMNDLILERKMDKQVNTMCIHREGYHDAPVDDDSNGFHTDRCRKRNKIIRFHPQTVMQHLSCLQLLMNSMQVNYDRWMFFALYSCSFLFCLSNGNSVCVSSWLLDCIIVKSWISLVSAVSSSCSFHLILDAYSFLHQSV